MPRIRTIKPAAFKDEDLFDAEQGTGLPVRWAYAGLWTVADRRGRFVWKPRELKAEILPHDEVDFSRVLDALTTRGLLVRYACDSVEFGWIPSFQRHQVVNHREEESKLPPHPEDPDQRTTYTRASRVPHACLTRPGHAPGEGKGREQEQVPPNPHGGEEPLGGDDDAAAWLLEAYPRWYAEERHGAQYRARPTLDWSAALGLTETWPDRAHLERMCRTFLRASNLPAAHANRSLEVFARSYASGCDAAVRQGAGA